MILRLILESRDYDTLLELYDLGITIKQKQFNCVDISWILIFLHFFDYGLLLRLFAPIPKVVL